MSETRTDGGIRTVLAASSAGTLIEWYDFYIFGSLATVMSGAFFPKDNPTAALLSTLATFATGFVVRPFGALVFGRVGDMVGRKHAFLVTLLVMGFATTGIGLLPTWEQAGVLAPTLLVILRLLQGLAMGGEYGGAATYVAEHAPADRRGFWTSFIQTTATLGFLLSLGVILWCRTELGQAEFERWGWRIPFLLSVVLVLFSWFIRRRISESPAFLKMKASGRLSTNPLKETLTRPENLKTVAIALVGATAGQAVVWYTGQFYALYFLQTVLKIDFINANIAVAGGLILGTPAIVAAGALSDRIGRKPVILAGFVAALAAWFPIYRAMAAAAVVPGDPDMTGLMLLVAAQVAIVGLVYGPMAAFLVEMFPTRIRYTSMSLPYHLGNGLFGGLVPYVGTALVASTGNMYAGLWYPMIVTAASLVAGWFLLKDRTGVPLDD